MSVKLIEFTPLDLSEFKPLDGVFFPSAKKTTIEAYKGGAHVFTFIDEKGVIGVGGFHLVMNGVADFWTLLGEGVHRNPREFSLKAGFLIDHAFDFLQLHRGQCHVNVGHDAGVRWIERFGFVRECVMKDFEAPGRDSYLYARCV